MTDEASEIEATADAIVVTEGIRARIEAMDTAEAEYLASVQAYSTDLLIQTVKETETASTLNGLALAVLREERRYRDTHGTWVEFCIKVLGLPRRTADNRITAALVRRAAAVIEDVGHLNEREGERAKLAQNVDPASRNGSTALRKPMVRRLLALPPSQALDGLDEASAADLKAWMGKVLAVDVPSSEVRAVPLLTKVSELPPSDVARLPLAARARMLKWCAQVMEASGKVKPEPKAKPAAPSKSQATPTEGCKHPAYIVSQGVCRACKVKVR